MLRCVHLQPLLLGAALAAGCSTTDNPLITRPQSVAWNVDAKIPDVVRAPRGHVLLGHVVGRGVATFTVQADPRDPNRRIWVVSDDEGGDLLDDEGSRIGQHQGNTWSLRDGAQITAEPLALVPQGRHLPWALLATTSHSGRDNLSATEFIEQLHTVGGPPAARGRADVGTQVRAEYSADYYFYGPVAAQTRVARD